MLPSPGLAVYMLLQLIRIVQLVMALLHAWSRFPYWMLTSGGGQGMGRKVGSQRLGVRMSKLVALFAHELKWGLVRLS